MDTKWNGTETAYFAAPKKRGWAIRAGAGFAAFFLGLSLLLGSLAAVAGSIVWQRDSGEWWRGRGWQDTESFRQEVSSTLRQFLSLGAGARLTWYDSERGTYYSSSAGVFTEAVESPPDEPWMLWEQQLAEGGYAVTDYTNGIMFYSPASRVEDLDLAFRNDKNILYYIKNDKDEKRTYSNGETEEFFTRRDNSAYNFYLIFQDGKARVWQDGTELDVYGGGVYGQNSLWFLPGYENFPAGEKLAGVTVCMAVREEPVRYFQISDDYSYSESSSMYYVRQNLLNSKAFYQRQAFFQSVGLALLVVWFFLRRDARLAAARIASWTVHVWTEARFLLVLGAVCSLLLSRSAYFYEVTYYGGIDELFFLLGDMNWRALVLLVDDNIPAVLFLFWTVWFIHNDHKYNPKESRRSLFRAFRAKDLKRPVQKRFSRIAGWFTVAVILLSAEIVAFLVIFSVDPCELLPYWSIWTLFLLPVLLALLVVWLYFRRQQSLARDLGLLADQVEAIRAGNLAAPLDLPADADLRQTAESLNNIQAGMKAALAEQTRSERMKVELVSNVSHDLKTPLTSILSYAELLRQEDLPPAAADYARIIDEKAQRLKSMVQDVFDVSKAAADQLPIQLERLDLGKLLRQTLADMADPIEQSPLTFKVDLPADPVMIIADGKRLYRVFQNLVQNALRYALPGSRVYLTLKTAANQAEASIRNTSKDELPEDVDFTARFVRGDESRTDGGSGLGLSIAKSFTEASGGSFRVETMADLFTAVVTFPLADAE